MDASSLPRAVANAHDPAWEYLPLTDLSFQVLLALAGEPLHGYAILRTVSERTAGRLEPATGTLYTAIRRLARDGLIEAALGSGSGRRGRSYHLTDLGRAVASLESERLASLVSEARQRSLLPDATTAPEPSRGG